jgi:2-polyprenyl-3-methyl-5-hydroxy-6-metoxy-1,4-benzoquinol methylase
MHGTAILVGAATPSSTAGVMAELATASRELAREQIELDVVFVSAAGGALIAAMRAAAEWHEMPVSVVYSDGEGAWADQRLAFEHALKHSAPDFVVTLDAAGHHDARQLPDLVRAHLASGSGVTIGSRWMHGGAAPDTSAPRALLSRLASRLVAWSTGLRRIHDITTSFRVIRADAADLVSTDPASGGDYGFYCEFVAVAQAYGFAVEEVPITFLPRFTPVAPLRLRDLIEFAADLHRIRQRIRRVRAEMQIDQATWAARSGRMRGQAAEIGSEFGALEELGELSEASHFTSWIAEALRPALGQRVLDVGAGFGALSRALAEQSPQRTVLAIEPAANVYSTLVERCAGYPKIDTRQVTSHELAQSRTPEQAGFDTVLYVNVLEHIRDDDAELRTAFELVAPGGALGLFVPAMPSLYGSLDYKSGHYRRYTRGQLAELVSRAGFVDVSARYLDPIGVVPYWVMYTLLDIQRLGSMSSRGYDRVLVPLGRKLERALPRPPFGKNLVAIARRPS